MSSDRSLRALILAPFGRDALVGASLLSEKGISTTVCDSLEDLVAQMEAGAGLALVVEEVLRTADLRELAIWIDAQPEWSDFPFVLLTRSGGGIERNPTAARLLETLGNVTFLERPFHPTTLISLAEAALRGRRRQYDARARLETLRELNETLAARVDAAMAEQKVAEAGLRQAQKMEAVGQLTGGVAHDFNNLLMAISGGINLLDRGAPDEARRQLIRDGMRKAVERGTTLTRQLLAFSRRQPLEARTLSLTERLIGMRELLDRALQGDVKVEVRASEDLWNIRVDPSELELAVLNLCVNARDAMSGGGAIQIAAENCSATSGALRGEAVRLSVSDTGAGMAEEVLAHVFEPFFTTKDIGKGSGLGLAQVYAFAAQSRGEVTIESNPGAGTRVIILFPRSHEPLPSTVEHIASDTDAPRGTGEVLLVEDDQEVAALVSEMLRSLGYTVLHVTSAAAALGALANGRSIDLVFSDIMMPGGMNGVELAREIRRRKPGLPVLLATGLPEAARGVDDGIEVLAKPYQIEALARALLALRIHQPGG